MKLPIFLLSIFFPSALLMPFEYAFASNMKMPKDYRERARHYGGVFGAHSIWKPEILSSNGGKWPLHQNSKSTGNKFSMNENVHRLEITIEFIGHNLNADQVAAQIVNHDRENKTLLVFVEDIGYEKKIPLDYKYDTHAIMTDFEDVSLDHQVLTILVPKYQELPPPAKPGSNNDKNATKPNLEEQVDVIDHIDRTEIKIEFIGHNLKKEHLTVQLVDQDTVVVRAEKKKQKYEKAFDVPPNHQVDKIVSKFKVVSRKRQILTVIIPKEQEIIDIPILTEDDEDYKN